MMTECKEFGWIHTVTIKFDPNTDVELYVELAGDGWSTTSRTPRVVERLRTLMDNARASRLDELVGKPITATFTHLGGTLTEWDIFTPVIPK